MNENLMEVLRKVTNRQTPGTSDLDSFSKVEHFANLIVAECVQVIQSLSHQSGDEWDRTIEAVEHAVNEHFGVENV